MDRLMWKPDADATTDASIWRNNVARRIFSAAPDAPETSFEDMLAASIKKVNALQIEADNKVQALAIGEVEDVSEVALASSRAEIAVRLLMEIRNKFLDAYQTLSRITG